VRLLIAESAPPAARDRRRDSTGATAGEDFRAILGRIAPRAAIELVQPIDGEAATLGAFDGVLLTGSPLALYRETAETRALVEFTRALFRSGTPAWGSCAGLQAAVVAAGGAVRPSATREPGFARRITRAEAGHGHAMLEGRPAAWDAPAIHTDEVERLPEGARLLARNAVTEVQAAEIMWEGGIFWGTQYHPEISLHEVAAALTRQRADLAEHGLLGAPETLAAYTGALEALHENRGRADLAWRLALDGEVTDDRRRTRELTNFLDALVRPTMAVRGRA
jgi:GMP synthase (glutamine-hydrolysing)